MPPRDKNRYSIRVFCRREIPDFVALLKEVLGSGEFFTGNYEVHPGEEELLLHYEDGKSPVHMAVHGQDDYFKQHVQELLFVLNLPAPSEKKRRVSEQLSASVNLLRLTFNRNELGDEDDVWEFMDVLEARVAQEFDGMIHTDDEIFYDKKLKRFYRL